MALEIVNSICAFCSQSFSKSTSHENSDFEKTTSQVEPEIKIKRFLVLLERFCNERNSPVPLQRFEFINSIDCCEKCLVVLDGFCSDYQRLKYIELQLECKVQRLVKIIKLANRISHWQPKPEGMFGSENIVHMHQVLIEDQENVPYLTIAFRSLRLNLIKSCAGLLSKSQPRVSLTRCLEAEYDSVSSLLSDPLPNMEREEESTPELIPSVTSPMVMVRSEEYLSLNECNAACGSTEHEDVEMKFLPGNCGSEAMERIDLTCITPSDGTRNKISSGKFEEPLYSQDGEQIASASRQYNLRETRRLPHGNVQTDQEAKMDECENNSDIDDISISNSSDGDDSGPNDLDVSPDTPGVYNRGDSGTETVNDKDTASASLKCEKCDKMFKKASSLKKHVRSLHGATNHTCSECHKSFRTIYLLQQHEWLHKPYNSWKFQCINCDGRFYKKQNLHTHMLTHSTDKKTFSCKICNMPFPSLRAMDLHIRKDHIANGNVCDCKIFKCQRCGKEFIDDGLLQNHIKRVHVTPTHQCSECGKVFKAMDKLRRHALIHKGPSSWKFQCYKCGYMCYTKDNLHQHMATHDKGLSLHCRFCSRQFSRKGNLESHILNVHAEEENVGEGHSV